MVSSDMPIGLPSNSSWLQSMRVEVSHCCCLPFSYRFSRSAEPSSYSQLKSISVAPSNFQSVISTGS